MAERVVESALPEIEFLVSPVPDEGKTPTGETKRGRPKGSVSKTTLDKLQADLAESLTEASAAIAVASPLAMSALDERAEKTASAIVTLAGGSPKLINALKKTVKARAVVTLAETLSAVSVAAMVDFGRVHPDHMLAEKFGVTENYYKAYPPEENTSQNGGQVVRRTGLFEAT